LGVKGAKKRGASANRVQARVTKQATIFGTGPKVVLIRGFHGCGLVTLALIADWRLPVKRDAQLFSWTPALCAVAPARGGSRIALD
jgi:hypothetical protein